MASSHGLEALEPLVGRWRSAGQTVPGAFDPGLTISGTDIYEWLGDGFLVHHVDVTMGEKRVQVIEIIGDYDTTTDTYAMRAFDGDGTTSTMRASVDGDGVWTFTDGSMRATLTIAGDGSAMAARWERSDDGASWGHWMDMRFTRV
jgi:hypothetical protein